MICPDSSSLLLLHKEYVWQETVVDAMVLYYQGPIYLTVGKSKENKVVKDDFTRCWHKKCFSKYYTKKYIDAYRIVALFF